MSLILEEPCKRVTHSLSMISLYGNNIVAVSATITAHSLQYILFVCLTAPMIK